MTGNETIKASQVPAHFDNFIVQLYGSIVALVPLLVPGQHDTLCVQLVHLRIEEFFFTRGEVLDCKTEISPEF